MRYVFWDLDGTLADTCEGIMNSYKYAYGKLNIKRPPDSLLLKGIGPPTDWGFIHIMGLDEKTAKKAYAYFREYYDSRGLYEDTIFDGVEDALKLACSLGCANFITSMKAQELCMRFVEINKWEEYFAGVYGAGVYFDKKSLLAYGIEESGADRKNSLMIGDMASDIAAGKACGIRTAAVYYGFGAKDDLKKADADYNIKKSAELSGFLARYAEESI